MANRWLFSGAKVAMVRSVGTPSDDTGGTLVDTTYADSAILVQSTNAIICDFIDSSGASDAATSGETLWCHWEHHYGAGTTTVQTVEAVLDSADKPWLALRTTSTSGTYGFYYNSGTGASPVWTLIGATFAISTGARHNHDIKVTLGSPHAAEIYVDGVLKASGTFTQASFTSADALQCASGGGSSQGVSQIMASIGINTVGGKVGYGKASGAGSNSGWTGAYTDINEVAGSDANLISAASSGLKATYAMNDFTLPSGYAVGDIVLMTRAKNDGSAPLNVKPVKRQGGVDSSGSSFSGISTGYQTFLTRYSGLSISDYNAIEFGVEAAT